MKNCCLSNNKSKKCMRKDKKVFFIPRRFSKYKCIRTKTKGFTMRASCAPYKFCKKTIKSGYNKSKKSKQSKQPKQFLYNPDDPKRSFDVYIDKNPNDTIPN